MHYHSEGGYDGGEYWGFYGHLWSWDYALGALWDFVAGTGTTPMHYLERSEIAKSTLVGS